MLHDLGRLVFVALFACLATAARADAWSEALGGLADKSFARRQAAVQALVATGDARAEAVLAALAEGRLYARGPLVLLERPDGTLVDAATDAPASAGGAKKITLNNQLRSALEAALAGFRLLSGTRAERLAALESLAANPPAALPEGLREASRTEADPTLREALALVVALVDLRAGDPAAQLEAVRHLAGQMRPEARNRLATLAEDPSAGEALRVAAARARDDIDDRRRLYGVLETVYFGLSLGSVLALCAIGLAVTFGVMGVINMAHGEMMMLGAYTTWLVQRTWPGAIEASLFIALPVAFLVTALAGLVIERFIVGRLYGRPLETLLATFGVSLFLQQLVRSQFGATNQAVQTPQWMSGSFELLEGLSLTWNRLYIMVFSVAVFVGLVALTRGTRFGLQMRAVAQNRAMARALGIRSRRVDALTFALGSGVAGLAGVALSQLTNVGPNLGQGYIVDTFMVVVFGGVGSLWGTLVAGLGLGMLTKLIEPAVGAVLGKVVVLVGIILFIQRYPRGLFPLRGRAAEA